MTTSTGTTRSTATSIGVRPVEGLGLHDRAGEAVEEEATGHHVGLAEAFLDDPEHDLVGDQAAGIHVGLGLETDRRGVAHRLAEHVAGGDVGRAVVLGEHRRLRSLPRALTTEDDQTDGHYFRNPS